MTNRADVGPTKLWLKVPANCLVVLVKEGLHPHSQVLDVGAGNLRVGRALVALLDPGGYHAIEPSDKLIDDALEEPGIGDLCAARDATWSPSEDVVAVDSVHEGSIDFVLCHGVVHHAPIQWIERLVEQSLYYLKPKGKLLLTYLEGAKAYGGDTWDYLPRHVTYPWSSIQATMQRAGMVARKTGHPHPGGRAATWVRGVRR